MNKKDLITGTLRQELVQRPFSDITVVDICRKCNTSRQVFYYYFTSLTDCLLECLLRDSKYGWKNSNSADYRTTTLETFKYIYDNQQFFNHVFDLGDQTYKVMMFIFSQMKVVLNRLIEENNPRAHEMSRDDRDYVTSYFASSSLFFFTRWIRKGFLTTPEEEVERLFTLSEWSLKDVSNRFIEYRKEVVK